MKAPEMIVAFTKLFFKPPQSALALSLIILSAISAFAFSSPEALWFMPIAIVLSIDFGKRAFLIRSSDLLALNSIALVFLCSVLLSSFGSGTAVSTILIHSIGFSVSYALVRIFSGRRMLLSLMACLPFLLLLLRITAISPELAFVPMVLLAAYSVFILAIDLVFLNVVNCTATGLFSSFISYWYDNDKSRVEAQLQRIGGVAEFQNRLLSFGVGGHKAHIVVPGIHYGPIGEIGSADFPAHIEAMSNRARSFVAAHSPSTHDMDLVAKEDLHSLVKRLVSFSENEDGYSELKLRYSRGSSHTATCHVLDFSSCSLVLFSNSPDTTEDIAADFGSSLLNRAKSVLSNPVVIDCHDSDTGKLIIVSGANQYGTDYLLAMEVALSKIAKKQYSNAKAGFVHWDSSRFSAGHTATNGASALVIASEQGTIALFFIDCNSIEQEFRAELGRVLTAEAEKLFGKRTEVLFCTSDTHEVNLTRGILNPLSDQKAVALLKHMLSEIRLENAKVRNSEFSFSAKVISNSREFAGLFAAAFAFFVTVIVASLVALASALFLL